MLEESGVPVLGMLVSVVLILGAAYWFTRYAAGRGLFGQARPGARMKIHDQLVLGRDQRLALVQVGGRWFLLGAASGSVSLVAELTAEEAAAWQEGPKDPEGGGAEKPGFREAFLQAIQQKRRR